MKRIGIMLLLFGLLAVPAAGIDEAHYRLGQGDILRITVYDHPDLETKVRVNADGSIPFPLIGTVRVGGLNAALAADAIAGRLGEGFLVNPQVAVFVEEFRSQKAAVMGQVKTPGLYELSGQTTLLQLISKAGGVTPDADETVTIKRPSGQGGEEVVTVNLKEIMERGDPALDVLVQGGDSILVNKAGLFYVTGQVKKPDAYKLEQGISVITAITRAGGFTDLAAQGKVRIIRKADGGEQVLKSVPMNEPIQANDVIVVPESFF